VVDSVEMVVVAVVWFCVGVGRGSLGVVWMGGLVSGVETLC
jgi:hypothetical protein